MRYFFKIVCLILLSTVCPVVCEGQVAKMPDVLDMEWLLSQPKYRNIHHDSFCRANNDREIGNNALPSRPSVLGYKTMVLGDVRVGIKNNYATNFLKKSEFGRCIKYINTGRADFHITAVRTSDRETDVRVAFYIKDINNFYYVALGEKKYEVFRYVNGKQKRIGRGNSGGKRLEVFVDNSVVQIVVDWKARRKVKLKGFDCEEQLCGLVFENSSVSCVDDFIVDYRDKFEDAGIDEAVERGDVEKPSFGTYCAEEGVCTASSTYVKSGRKSYRFELKKPSQMQVKANRDKALHSTIMLDGIREKDGYDFAGRKGGNKPLDSFVLSFDVLFPATGEERWELDEIFQELFIQEHHIYYNIPFSPSLAIYIDKGRLFLNTIWNEAIAKGTRVEDNNLHYKHVYIARLNNNDEESYLEKMGNGNQMSLPYLEKGMWHNFTLYVRLGYNENQVPRTVVYLDGRKVVDWITPNSYNCQEYGEYMEFGIYKWNWNSQENRDKTHINQRVLYFDNIKYYI